MSEMITVETGKCAVCDNTTVFKLDRKRFDRWQAGENIQVVFPELSAMQRETLISGVCSDKCWDELWGGQVDD